MLRMGGEGACLHFVNLRGEVFWGVESAMVQENGCEETVKVYSSTTFDCADERGWILAKLFVEQGRDPLLRVIRSGEGV
jgi:hypothetical protein